MIPFRRPLTGLALLAACASAPAATFTIADIEVEGLRSIAPGTVFTYLPFEVGETFDDSDSTRVIEALYETGFFRDVQVFRDGDVLRIRVEERPTIADLRFDGNKKVETEQLQQALKDIGLGRGRVLDPRAIEQLEVELQRVYFSLGQYGARIDVDVEDLGENRVAVDIDIVEGKPAKIREIVLVGNEDFPADTLRKQFALGPKPWFKFWGSSDQYSREKLAADLENLRSFYLDRGYLKFTIDSTQVTITPDRKDIEIVVNVTEGERYRISEIDYQGNLLLSDEELAELTQVAPDEYFNRERVVETADGIARTLGNDGFAFANVTPMPEIDEANKTAKLVFRVDPGKRVTVRRIDFAGNFNTDEEVYRRELRQMEGSWYAADQVDRSRTRLERLPGLQAVRQELVPVPGVDDQVDLRYELDEQLSGSFTAGIGYSQSEGVLFNLGLSQENFLGSGKAVSVNVERSSFREYYQFDYRNPYFTVDGISQGFGVFFRKSKAAELSLSRYLLDDYGANVSFGVPLSEFTFARAVFQAERQNIKATPESPSWVTGEPAFDGDRPGPGFTNDHFLLFTVRPSWTYDSRNRAFFPTSGQRHRLEATVALPGSELLYYAGEYDGRVYFPVWEDITLTGRAQVALAESYGSTRSDYAGKSDYYDNLPPTLNYWAGGPNSVRGYEDFSLGPRDSNGDPMGGAFKTVGGVELVTPVPFLTEQASTVRMSFFYDIGNVYKSYSDFDAGELRQSVGVGVNWFSPVGPLTFSIAQPLNDKPDDRTQSFQFSVGAGF
ncbi:MAG: outer membrane protein assembly factor BamA [Halothiobacillaceae bacterium]